MEPRISPSTEVPSQERSQTPPLPPSPLQPSPVLLHSSTAAKPSLSSHSFPFSSTNLHLEDPLSFLRPKSQTEVAVEMSFEALEEPDVDRSTSLDVSRSSSSSSFSNGSWREEEEEDLAHFLAASLESDDDPSARDDDGLDAFDRYARKDSTTRTADDYRSRFQDRRDSFFIPRIVALHHQPGLGNGKEREVVARMESESTSSVLVEAHLTAVDRLEPNGKGSKWNSRENSDLQACFEKYISVATAAGEFLKMHPLRTLRAVIQHRTNKSSSFVVQQPSTVPSQLWTTAEEDDLVRLLAQLNGSGLVRTSGEVTRLFSEQHPTRFINSIRTYYYRHKPRLDQRAKLLYISEVRPSSTGASSSGSLPLPTRTDPFVSIIFAEEEADATRQRERLPSLPDLEFASPHGSTSSSLTSLSDHDSEPASSARSESGLELKGSLSEDDETLKSCSNCRTRRTSMWRRDSLGGPLCNACALFLKLHKVPRPLSLKSDTIRKRNRKKPNKVSRPSKHSVISRPSAQSADPTSSSSSSLSFPEACALLAKLRGFPQPLSQESGSNSKRHHEHPIEPESTSNPLASAGKRRRLESEKESRPPPPPPPRPIASGSSTHPQLPLPFSPPSEPFSSSSIRLPPSGNSSTFSKPPTFEPSILQVQLVVDPSPSTPPSFRSCWLCEFRNEDVILFRRLELAERGLSDPQEVSRFARWVCETDCRWLDEDVDERRRKGMAAERFEEPEYVIWYTSGLKDRELEKRRLMGEG